ELRRLLDSMNAAPGWIDPANPLVPLGQFDSVHFARFVLLEDETLADIEIFGVPRRSYPLALAFVGDVDGLGDDFLGGAPERAGPGRRTFFACCDGFSPQTALLGWMRARSVHPAASYVNWPGRTVRQIREEAALHAALLAHARDGAADLARLRPREAHAALRRMALADVAAGRLRLSEEEKTPFGWWLRNLVHLVAVPLVLLLLSPILLVVAAFALVRLRHFEKTDPELPVDADPQHVLALAALEDHDVTNQFTALGSLKPGRLRLAATMFFFFAIDYTARHLYGRG